MSANFDQKASAIRNLKSAVKKSQLIDKQGRKVPKYIYIGDLKGENPLWSEIALTPLPVMERGADMLRTKAVQTLVQAQVIVDSYNDNHNLGTPIQLELDLSDEVTEAALMRKDFNQNDPD